MQSSFYEVADAMSNGQRAENIFSTRSNTFHSRYMKPYQKHFGMNNIMAKGHLMDDVLVSLCQQLENRFMDGNNKGKPADLAAWIEFGNSMPIPSRY
jgi:hypothetical protein